jgi:hypothetical protein
MTDPEPPTPPAPPAGAVAPATLSPDRRHVWNGSSWVPASYSPDGAYVWDGTAWLAAPPAAPVATGQSIVDFEFPVGQKETHKVHFRFDGNQGWQVIDVDGEVIVNEREGFSLGLAKPYRFQVGTSEPHNVVIERRRELMATGHRPQTCRVWVDDQFVGLHDGTGWVAA